MTQQTIYCFEKPGKITKFRGEMTNIHFKRNPLKKPVKTLKSKLEIKRQETLINLLLTRTCSPSLETRPDY